MLFDGEVDGCHAYAHILKPRVNRVRYGNAKGVTPVERQMDREDMLREVSKYPPAERKERLKELMRIYKGKER